MSDCPDTLTETPCDTQVCPECPYYPDDAIPFSDWLSINNAKVRNATLDAIQDHNDGRLEGMESLMATPSEERCESAQDVYLKEAYFELTLIKHVIESLRSNP
jgi:hypothetical protein